MISYLRLTPLVELTFQQKSLGFESFFEISKDRYNISDLDVPGAGYQLWDQIFKKSKRHARLLKARFLADDLFIVFIWHEIIYPFQEEKECSASDL